MEPHLRRTWKKVTSLVLGFFECLFFAALKFGWPSLVYVYQKRGLFSERCTLNDTARTDNLYRGEATDTNLTKPYIPWTLSPGVAHYFDTTYCAEASDMFNLCFSVATVVISISSFFAGQIFDRFGLLVARLIATFLYVPGMLMLAYSLNGDLAYMIFPGLCLTGMAGVQINVTAYHIAVQAGRRKLMVGTWYSGAIDCGVIMFLFVKEAYDRFGLSSTTSLGILTSLWIVVILHTLLLPKYKFDDEELSVVYESEKTACDSEGDDAMSSLTFQDCLKSPLFWLMSWWACVIQIHLALFTAGLNAWLALSTDSEEKVSWFVSVFGYAAFGGLLFGPFPGLLVELTAKERLKEKGQIMLEKAKATTPALWFGSLVAVVHSIVIHFESDSAIYIAIILNVLMRAFLFGNMVLFVSHVFPPHVFGKCLGLPLLISGLVSSLQYPIFLWSNYSKNFEMANHFGLALGISCLAQPIYIELKYLKHSKSLKNTEESMLLN